jgi:hypothetical protein
MEFENIYNETYIKAHHAIENYIKEFLTKEENSLLDFTVNFNEIVKTSQQNDKLNKFNSLEPFITLYVKFENGLKSYRKDKIDNAFKLKVLPLYNITQELPQEYTFEKLIQEIAAFNAETSAFNIFSNNRPLFERMYDSNDFSKFEIKEYDQVLENTDIYIYYDKIVYPQKYKSKKNATTVNKKPLQSTIFSNLDEESELIVLTEKEIALLIYIQTQSYINNRPLPSTENYKLYSLIKVKPYKSFENENSFKSTFHYKILKGSYDKLKLENLKDATKKDLHAAIADIDSLREKIMHLNVPNVNKELNMLHNMLQAYL